MILVNLLSLLLHALYFILRPFFKLVHIRRRPNIPPIRNPLLKVSASTLANKIRNGELSSQTAVEAYIDRIKEVNPFVNAVVEDRFEAAINDAKICDEMLKTGQVTAIILEKEKPLFGVPITIKESCSVAGMSLTGGNLKRKGVKASEDGSVVEIVKNAGAIPLCVSNTSELCSGLHASNFIVGSTKNPYDTRKSPGGSSGGEGALLGAGASIVGIGSDFIGSIRIPSLFNGIFGHKPTPGIVPIRGHFPMSKDPAFQRMLVLGPMARYAEDLHLVVKILSSKCEKPLHLDEPVDVKSLRVFYLENFNSFCGTKSTTSDIRRTIKEATRYLAENGACVQHLSQDWVHDVFVFLMSFCGNLEFPEECFDNENPEEKKSAMLGLVKVMFGLSDCTFDLALIRLLSDMHGFVPVSRIEHYKTLREGIRSKLNNLLGSDGVFVCPTFPQPTTYPGLIPFRIDCTIYCAFGNMMDLPSTHVPMGLNNDGLPIGFQVMAASYQDRLCLSVARQLEKAFGGWVPPLS
ncbi:fatty-acid amide hydrolase 2-A-like [Colletes latitarsis]|uniref:fatty-acid amide hydrolase 2-A-like n=1 Tax=Colletes latitarsis TaxID=2605962 RepID=UPI0040368937